MSSIVANAQVQPQEHRADWLAAARWGIMCHYLDSPAGSQTPSMTSTDDWNRRIDRFEVKAFVDQVEAAGAGYVIFTIGQNRGHYCSPNETYSAIVGRRPSLCSQRDLIAEIAHALARVGVRLIAYLPSGAPAFDAKAVSALEWKDGPYRLAAFQQKWESVICEWSNRWGDAVAGWWIDGCLFAAEMYDQPDAPNFGSLSAALRSGNSGSILAFNSGVKTPIVSITSYEDYTAGELDLNFPTIYKWNKPERFVDGAQYHALSFLGDWWGEGSPRFSSEFVAGYTSDVNSRMGVVTWDVPISPDGRIPGPFIKQLECLPRHIR